MNPAKNMISELRKSHIPKRARSNDSTCSAEPWDSAAWSMIQGSFRSRYREQTEQPGQIRERREKKTARPLPRTDPGKRQAEGEERESQGRGAREVRPARDPEPDGREADHDERQRLQD